MAAQVNALQQKFAIQHGTTAVLTQQKVATAMVATSTHLHSQRATEKATNAMENERQQTWANMQKISRPLSFYIHCVQLHKYLQWKQTGQRGNPSEYMKTKTMDIFTAIMLKTIKQAKIVQHPAPTTINTWQNPTHWTELRRLACHCSAVASLPKLSYLARHRLSSQTQPQKRWSKTAGKPSEDAHDDWPDAHDAHGRQEARQQTITRLECWKWNSACLWTQYWIQPGKWRRKLLLAIIGESYEWIIAKY